MTENPNAIIFSGVGKPLEEKILTINDELDENEAIVKISIATVYRAVKLFEEVGILDKLEFGDGRARYEDADRDHHDHLIDLQTGEVIEFIDTEIEALQEKIANRLGYTLKDHRLELFGVPIKRVKND